MLCSALLRAIPRRPSTICVQQDIARAQQIVKASTEREIEHGKRVVEQLRYLSTYLAEAKTPRYSFGHGTKVYSWKVYADQYHYECTVEIITGGGPGAPSQEFPIFIIRKTDGQEVERFDLSKRLQCPSAFEDVKSFAKNLVGIFEEDLAQNQNRWESLGEEFPEVWSYWDFVYFSTVTQTTVGYGDIVPNSTSVRAGVVVQLIIGTGLLVVGLNLVLRGKKQ